MRNLDKLKISAFGRYSPNGNIILQFRETSKTFDFMTFLAETLKVNIKDGNTRYYLQIMLNKYYNQQNQIVEIHGNSKYTKNPIKKVIINNKLDKIRNELFKLGNEFSFLFNDYYSFIKDNISLNITEKEISDMIILKREYDKRERNQKEIRLAKDFIKELSDDY